MKNHLYLDKAYTRFQFLEFFFAFSCEYLRINKLYPFKELSALNQLKKQPAEQLKNSGVWNFHPNCVHRCSTDGMVFLLYLVGRNLILKTWNR
jgi:hypothetical protein